uniref:Lung seven transmembrane receptor n=1 Tax=Parascaris univalens TaxID=6257 RepID=A0A915AJE5_PARUN
MIVDDSLSLLFHLTIFSHIVQCKIHHLALTDDSRRNILLTSFGYDTDGTFELTLHNFTVPEELVSTGVTREMRNTDRFGVIGFTLSRGKAIVDGMRSKPHVCQLSQQDQGYDALFFVFNFTQNSLNVIRTGSIQDIALCRNISSCGTSMRLTNEKLSPASINENSTESSTDTGLFGKLHNMFFPTAGTGRSYVDYIPLSLVGGHYSTSMAIKFTDRQRGRYHFVYHNCFNYRAHGYSNRVAVDFTVDIIERNADSYLSAGDIAKPKLFLYMSAMFAFAAFLWIYNLCRSGPSIVYRVHHLMTALVILKSLSLFFHGINFYFVSVYGHQREVWAVVFYITHLLKGALLFGTLILIGTGYTFFKNFLTDRDRKLFMFVLPLQVVDNVAMIIIEESEFGQQSYQFWFQIFIFFDVICCMAILLPVIWSMRHLQEGARSDGKAAFNLEKLRLFRHFYLIIISYIYLTRVIKFLVEFVVPFNYDWVTDAVVELSTLFFFVIAGHKFRPQERNPYLRLSQEDDDAEAITRSGIFANISRLNRTSVRDETLDDIPGMLGGSGEQSEESDPEDIFESKETRSLVTKSSPV